MLWTLNIPSFIFRRPRQRGGVAHYHLKPSKLFRKKNGKLSLRDVGMFVGELRGAPALEMNGVRLLQGRLVRPPRVSLLKAPTVRALVAKL